MNKKEKGITLIALIITIIILIILSTVAINMIYKLGIVKISINSTINYVTEQQKELGVFNGVENLLDNLKVEIGDSTSKEEEITKLASVDVFEKMERNNHTESDLYRYGAMAVRTGINEYAFNVPHKFGTGSTTGINSNTYTLIIDFETLTSKLGITKNLEGISIELYHIAGTSASGYTSWIETKMECIYEDGTKDEVSTERITATQKDVEAEPTLTLNFNKDKVVKQIQIKMSMYDSDYGAARGYIKNINFINAEIEKEPVKNNEPITEVFSKMEENNYTVDDLYRYGIIVARTGANEDIYNKINSLGSGSSAGKNRNTFNLTMDIETITAKLGIKRDLKGISLDISRFVLSDNSEYTSWAGGKMTVIYEDDTKEETAMETVSAANKTITDKPVLMLEFANGKKAKEIQIAFDMYDNDYGSAIIYINKIKLLQQ